MLHIQSPLTYLPHLLDDMLGFVPQFLPKILAFCCEVWVLLTKLSQKLFGT